MSRASYLFTSESVSEGHPDKVCDRISDEVVDAFFDIAPRHGWDPRNVRVACETLATTNRIVIAGETRGPSQIPRDYIAHLARLAVKDIGYEQPGFHWETATIEVHLHAQSSDIAQGVDSAGNKDEGAGDQGIMFGYACRETPDLMPAPIYYAHHILKEISQARRSGETQALGPDAKSQVTIRYESGKPVEATQIVVSTQHYDEKLSSHDIQAIVEPYVRKARRKIIVDTYGGAAPHGGGAFSGKDPTKVDRSAAYAARYLAKNVVAAGLADRCAIQIAYAIGVAKPLSLYVDCYGTSQVGEARLEKLLDEVMDLSPRGIREHLSLNRPIYARTSAYGHFGRAPEPDGGFSWERTDLVEELRRAAS